MIKIRVFSSFAKPGKDCSVPLIRISELLDDAEYNVKYCFTTNNDYTHAIILNTAMPELHIPKEHVIGLAFEPIQFLGLTPRFIQYAQNKIGKYYIGDKRNLSEPFTEHFAYLYHVVPPKKIFIKKPNLISMMISQKNITPGHAYRHALVKEILKSNLPVDIYGRGCEQYAKSNDNRLKGAFKDSGTVTLEDSYVMYADYKFHISIENSITPHYFSEKIMDPLLCNTTPVYLGCTNITQYFPNQIICLSGNIEKDMQLLTDICEYPDKYQIQINVDKIKETISIKRVIETWYS